LRDKGFRQRLVEREPARLRRRAHVRHPGQLQDLADRAVFTGDAVQHREDDRVGVGGDRRQQVGARVAHVDLDADAAQRLRDAVPGAQRHVALGRQSAGEDQYPVHVHRCP
jgi:hypothetical protein